MIVLVILVCGLLAFLYVRLLFKHQDTMERVTELRKELVASKCYTDKLIDLNLAAEKKLKDEIDILKTTIVQMRNK